MITKRNVLRPRDSNKKKNREYHLLKDLGGQTDKAERRRAHH